MEITRTEQVKATGRRRTRKKIRKSRRFPVIGDLQMTRGKTDTLLVLFLAMLVIFGIIMVFSSSYYYSISKYGTPYHFLIRQVIWAVGGFVCFVMTSCFDYHKYYKLAPWAAILGFILLVLLFTPLGIEINNAKRWLGAGPITIMPGELAKIFAILFTAWFLSGDPERIRRPLTGILPVIALGGGYAILIFKQPNLSTAITVVLIVGFMMIVAGLQKRWILTFLGLGAAAVFGFVTFARDTYQYERIATFLDPFANMQGEGYQIVQSLLAIGSGGLTGVGLGKSVQKSLYLPEPQNDFILAIIGEELGMIGILGLLLLYCLFLWRGIHIALHCRDQFGVLLASGIVLMVLIQVVLNVAVVTNSMPATGINLPFISYGGNGMIIFMLCTGVLVNISRQNSDSGPEVEGESEE